MSALYQIEKLDGNNFESWAIQMKSILVHSGYWKLVNGELKPEDGKDDAEIAKYKSDDEKALATICLSVKPSQLNYIKGCKSSSEAWTKLKDVYRPSGPIQKVTLYKKLLNLRMDASGDMVSHINVFTDIADKLQEIGISIQEELLSIILLSSLPQHFENFVIAVETRDNLPNLIALKQKLIEEDERRKNDKVEMKNQKAFGMRTTKKEDTRKKHQLATDQNSKENVLYATKPVTMPKTVI